MQTRLHRFTFLAALFAVFMTWNSRADALGPASAQTPPMGWNSWNHFARRIDDATVRAQADAMVASGMRDAGYVYINIDDAWEGERDASGLIRSNSKFPDMKALADYVHNKGLKLGIYSGPGPKTCAGYEGSLGHEEQDAKTYAEWGIDYLKYDLCSLNKEIRAAESLEAGHKIMVEAYTTMGNALRNTGRPIVYSLCQYGNDAAWRWGAGVGGNLWRTGPDIKDNYASMSEIGFTQAGLARFAGPGHWNDPDMLEIGNGGMNEDESRTHMSLWAILAAPLLAGNDLTKMTPETIALLTNPEVIVVDQDKAGEQGDRVETEGPIEVWVRRLADGSRAVGIFNRHQKPQDAIVDFGKIGIGGPVKARDLWLRKDLGSIRSPYTARIPGHGVLLLKVQAAASLLLPTKGAMPGFTLNGDPEQGTTWTYTGTDNGVEYNLTGYIRKPRGNGPFPAILLSHGKDGSADAFVRTYGEKMVPWNVVVIGVNYTHASHPGGSPGEGQKDWAASKANVLRARKCIEILRGLGYVDMKRLAAHGHSMGAYLTAALAGAYPNLFVVASHTAGGIGEVGGHSFGTTREQARKVRTPYLIIHGENDATVPIAEDKALFEILKSDGVDAKMIGVPEGTHRSVQLSLSDETLNYVKSFYEQHGLFN